MLMESFLEPLVLTNGFLLLVCAEMTASDGGRGWGWAEGQAALEIQPLGKLEPLVTFQDVFLIYVHGCFACLSVYHVCALVSEEARRGCHIPWHRRWDVHITCFLPLKILDAQE